MELLKDNPSMNDLIQKLNEVVKNINGSLPSTENELSEVKKLISFGSDTLAGRLNAKLWYFKTQELMTASTELCEGDSCFVLKDGVTTGNGTFEYWYIHKTNDVKDIIDSYVDLSNPDLVAVKLQDMTLKDIKDTLSAQISNQSKDLNTKISNLKTDTETALSGKADLVNGLIPASQLPSYVDDVIESWLKDEEFPKNAYAKEDTEMTTPITPEESKIYVNLLNNKTYRWGGNFYVEISKSLAIGETAATAFSGNRGVQLEEKIKYLENYVTPEMFGAVGDGVADDSIALLAAISTGYPILGKKGSKYCTKSQLVFSDNCYIMNIHLIAISKIESVIKYSKRNTRIYDIQIDCNNLADYGILGASDVPKDTLYFAIIENCSVTNSLLDGYNTGSVRTFINGCFAKNCERAGFYIATTDTKHDNLTPIDCKYGVYVKGSNTSINRFHPWSWNKHQTGLFVDTSCVVDIGYFYNDTNQYAIEFSSGVNITIGTLRNFNNQNAPSAISDDCRMLTRSDDSNTYIPYITIGTIDGDFIGYDDYFLYPDNYNINYMSVNRINVSSVKTRFDKKMFRLSNIPVTLLQDVLNKFEFSSEVLTIYKVTLERCTSDLHGYNMQFRVQYDSGSNVSITPSSKILKIQYIGDETNNVYYDVKNIYSSYSTKNFYSVRESNDLGQAKGMSIRMDVEYTLSGILFLFFNVYVNLY